MKHYRVMLVILSTLAMRVAFSQDGDTYQNAIVIPHQSAWESTLSNSGMTLQSPISSCQNFSLNNSNKWFVFNASSNYVNIKITGDNAANNTRLVIWELSGAVWTELACGVGTTSLSATSSLLGSGNQYYFSVEVRYESINYVLSVTNGNIPGNHITSPIEVPHKEYWENTLTNSGMTLEPPVSSCQSFTLNNSNKWYKFKASTNYVKIEILSDNAGNNTRAVLWGQSGAGWAELACGVGTTTLFLEKNSLVVNTEYFLSIETRYTTVPYRLIIRGGVFTGFWTKTDDVVHTIELANKVGVGTSVVPNEYAFGVNGKAIMEEVNVQLSETWPDYVFDKQYSLLSINELKKYIESESHLPEVPTAAEINAKGQNLGAMNVILLKKIEELTLYSIQLQSQIDLIREQSKTIMQDLRILIDKYEDE